MARCHWAESDELLRHYHDEEWGVPVHDDRRLFEFLCLEGAQAGLSWLTILRKRDEYRKVFDNFEAEKIVTYNESKITELMRNPGIIRNRLKLEGVVKNARAFLEVQAKYGSFDRFIWDFDDATAMSQELKRRGFTFVGPTICYALMQAIGMVNDHDKTCFRYSLGKV